MSAAIASITEANEKFHGLISGRSDRGKHWNEVRFHVLLYLQKDLINIKIVKIFQFWDTNILIFIVHFNCHLGILVEVFWFVLTTSPFPFSSLAICEIFNIPPKILIEKHICHQRCDFEETIHKKDNLFSGKSKTSRRQISENEILVDLTSTII